jgi:hypothetical protein
MSATSNGGRILRGGQRQLDKPELQGTDRCADGAGRDVRIDLGGAHIAMAQQSLNDANVASVFQ